MLMELTSVSNIKSLLKKHNAILSKRFGQNFLIDKNVIKKILNQAKIGPKDIVLEIGPGIGTMTIELAKKAKKIIAVEKDFKMVEILKDTLSDFQNIEIIQDDILKFVDSKFVINDSYKVVANLPYYITSPVIRKLLEINNKPKEIILMVQKEVAQRICACAPKTNLLAISVQFYAMPKIISYVSKKSFYPKPKVDSAIIQLKTVKQNSKIDKDKFFKIVKAGFSHPRKQLANNLLKELDFSDKKINKEEIISLLDRKGIFATQRPETLTLKNWIELTKVL
ncbi:MAG: 16S rRNA (adenine(1518)-N(6)/adenine(1519)-N(6))-dimethyltransferase RsmA [Patescibacteria group bacterium]|nr:16S rRNA (adenine(1518)-N(6)/adenine(1519)-N(6))-dimethyltransferase RsmA [Patescibacteria group bacterium]